MPGLGRQPLTPRKNAALRLQATIADLLGPHHQGVHDAERGGLAASGSDHLLTAFDADVHAPAALATIVGAAKGTEWEAHFADPTVQAIITDTVRNHFNTSAMIERLWHADRNPADPVATAFKARHHNETVVPADEPAADAAI